MREGSPGHERKFRACAAVRPPVERIGREPGTPDAAILERGRVKRKPYAGHGLGAKRRQPNRGRYRRASWHLRDEINRRFQL